jgi:hypothetical protein
MASKPDSLKYFLRRRLEHVILEIKEVHPFGNADIIYSFLGLTILYLIRKDCRSSHRTSSTLSSVNKATLTIGELDGIRLLSPILE